MSWSSLPGYTAAPVRTGHHGNKPSCCPSLKQNFITHKKIHQVSLNDDEKERPMHGVTDEHH